MLYKHTYTHALLLHVCGSEDIVELCVGIYDGCALFDEAQSFQDATRCLVKRYRVISSNDILYYDNSSCILEN